jgi:hypothetical protein
MLTEAGALTEAVVERFVIRQNIEHYRELLKITRDPTERRRIENCYWRKKPGYKEIRRRSQNEIKRHMDEQPRFRKFLAR